METDNSEYRKFLQHLNTFLTSEHVKEHAAAFPAWFVYQTGISSELRRLEFEERF